MWDSCCCIFTREWEQSFLLEAEWWAYLGFELPLLNDRRLPYFWPLPWWCRSLSSALVYLLRKQLLQGKYQLVARLHHCQLSANIQARVHAGERWEEVMSLQPAVLVLGGREGGGQEHTKLAWVECLRRHTEHSPLKLLRDADTLTHATSIQAGEAVCIAASKILELHAYDGSFLKTKSPSEASRHLNQVCWHGVMLTMEKFMQNKKSIVCKPPP